MSSAYLSINAWREMLARIFDGSETQLNVSPEWLINPATRRRLKLDILYPEIGIAVRFSGLTAKGQRRRSDWEVIEDEQRDQTRVELCRLNGVQLAVIDPFADPAKQMDGVLRVISRARRLLAQSKAETKADQKRKRQGMDALGRAHQQAMTLRGRLTKRPEQTIATLAESWRDREAGLVAELQQASQIAQEEAEPFAGIDLDQLQSGQRIVHSHFGDGVITGINGAGSEAQITILFDADNERTFLARLLTDKIKLG